MENNRIQDIITKSLLEEATSEELLFLDSWRKESLDNENLYNEYATIWNISENYEPVDFQPKAESAYQKHLKLLADENDNVIALPAEEKSIVENTIPTKTRIFTLRRIASIAALFVVLFGAMVVFNSMSTTTITASDGVRYASLQDGSAIWLDEGSTLSYGYGFGEYHRDLKLEGKAFFEVKKDKNLAFNVASDDFNVSVLGTSFTVDTKDGEQSVAVKTGKVAVESNESKITLLPNEKVEIENNKFIEKEASLKDVAWRNSDLSFENARLDQVISDLNLFHGNKIKLESSNELLGCLFTSKSLKDTEFENIIKILEVTYDMTVEQSENEDVYTFKISDCK